MCPLVRANKVGRPSQAKLFIRPALAIYLSGELWELPTALARVVSFMGKNVKMSICSARSIPIQLFNRLECQTYALKSPNGVGV